MKTLLFFFTTILLGIFALHISFEKDECIVLNLYSSIHFTTWLQIFGLSEIIDMCFLLMFKIKFGWRVLTVCKQRFLFILHILSFFWGFYLFAYGMILFFLEVAPHCYPQEPIYWNSVIVLSLKIGLFIIRLCYQECVFEHFYLQAQDEDII